MRWIYLSPHLDDAVLSAGGFICEQTASGIEFEIWTIMSGIPPGMELTQYAKGMHDQWGTGTPEETIRHRRDEDRKAASIVGARTVQLDFLDCIYRRGRDGTALYSDIHSAPDKADEELTSQIADALMARLKPDDVILCQLAIGGHVDHVVVRSAAEMLARPLIYCADIPYLFNYPEDLSIKTAGMQESLQPVSETNFGHWLEAIGAYVSQINSLFENSESMQAKMRNYWSKRGGIPLWRFD
jgi:LmbE family N-acetylglucosaminyl deacetylase